MQPTYPAEFETRGLSHVPTADQIKSIKQWELVWLAQHK